MRRRSASAGAGGHRRVRANCSLRPSRSVPNASSARAGTASGRNSSPSGRAPAAGGRSPGKCSKRATGSAKCRPAEPRTATGSHGSWRPVVSTPAASAAAATRITAPRLPKWRGSSSSTSGACPSAASTASGSLRTRRAMLTTPVCGTYGPSRLKASAGQHDCKCLHRLDQIRSKTFCQTCQLDCVRARDQLHGSAKAKRVLERVKALQHDPVLAAARLVEAPHDRGRVEIGRADVHRLSVCRHLRRHRAAPTPLLPTAPGLRAYPSARDDQLAATVRSNERPLATT